MKTGVVALLCLASVATATLLSNAIENAATESNATGVPDSNSSILTPSPAEVEAAEEADAQASVAEAANIQAPIQQNQVAPTGAPIKTGKAPKADEIYSAARKVPAIEPPAPKAPAKEEAKAEASEPAKDSTGEATSFSGDVPDIDASVRERIEQDSKRIGKVAENLVGVQGDINRVEKEVLGKVFDMSTMKAFLNEHENAIKDHEKLDQEQDDLTKQATSLSKQLDKAINETSTQDKKHRAQMTQLSSQVTEDKSVIQGLQKELVPLIEMQKEVAKLPPVNANQTAANTKAVASAQAATEELVYEKSKIKTYQETTKNLMKELVKQHDYATKCHERLTQLNTQLHEVATKEARMKYEQNRASAQGNAMAKTLEGKNKLIQKRLEKAKKNVATVNFAKSSIKAKIGSLQTEGQIKLEKLKEELGKLRMQSASIETAMMAKITNRKLIEKALRGSQVQVEDMQEKLLAGKLDKLRRNNTQMTKDLNEIRNGLQKAQVNTAKAEAERTLLLSQANELKQQAANKTVEAQEVAREALQKVVAARAEDDAMAEKAQKATMQAQASMLTKCSAIWDKEHASVNERIKECKQIKIDLEAMKATVATLKSSVQAAQAPR